MKKNIKTLLFMFAASILFFYSCDDDDDSILNGSYTDVMSNNLKSDLVDDASISPYEAIFDVSPYFNKGHIPFATNVGSVDNLGTIISGLDKSKRYLVYCHADGPSIAGAELMLMNGFTMVYRLEGNYGAWDDVSFEDIAANEVNAKMDAGNFEAIFDVSPYYDDGHLPGAINAKGSAGGTDLAVLIEGMDKTKTYLVYCHADAPAMAGAQLMEDAGFTNVYRLEGNYGAWLSAGYDIEQ